MLNWIVMGALVLAPFATYGAMKVRERIVVAAAVAGERTAGISICNAKILDFEARHNRSVAEATAAAVEAGNAAAAIQTPEDIKRLCAASASCRDRGNL